MPGVPALFDLDQRGKNSVGKGLTFQPLECPHSSETTEKWIGGRR